MNLMLDGSKLAKHIWIERQLTDDDIDDLMRQYYAKDAINPGEYMKSQTLAYRFLTKGIIHTVTRQWDRHWVAVGKYPRHKFDGKSSSLNRAVCIAALKRAGVLIE